MFRISVADKSLFVLKMAWHFASDCSNLCNVYSCHLTVCLFVFFLIFLCLQEAQNTALPDDDNEDL